MLYRLLCILTLLISLPVTAQNSLGSQDASSDLFGTEEPEFLRVEQAYSVTPQIEQNTLNLNWLIEPGYYLYQHQFKAEARTADTTTSLDLAFARGKRKYDEFFDKELVVYYSTTTVTANFTPPKGNYELKISSQGCADAGLCYPPRHQYFSVNEAGEIKEIAAATLGGSSPDAPTSTNTGNSATNATAETFFLPYVLLGAILGGLILNLMPCVFPVLSLKALSFASAQMNSKSQHLHGWAYTLGVVGSFVVAAIFIIVARQAGESLGWGFQLQQPSFVAFMAYLFFVMGLSLSGLFHIGTSWMGAGQSLTTGHGLSSSFFTGVLAALVASPCTAPFMATALGYALTQPAYISLAIFAALGFGMALPFLLLSYSPVLAKYLPAPGPWMDTLKQVLAFPLYLTSVWLLWVLARQATSDGAMAVLSGAVLITFGIWVMQRQANSSLGKIFVRGSAAISLCAAAYLAWTSGDFRHQESDQWEAYSQERLASLRAEGTPVFVDLTADWCITCKFNERVALNTEAVTKFAILNDIIMLQGDWTNADPEISALLEEFGRSGVPLYLMYPASPSAAPEVLPQILTQDIVLASMEKALP